MTISFSSFFSWKGIFFFCFITPPCCSAHYSLSSRPSLTSRWPVKLWPSSPSPAAWRTCGSVWPRWSWPPAAVDNPSPQRTWFVILGPLDNKHLRFLRQSKADRMHWLTAGREWRFDCADERCHQAEPDADAGGGWKKFTVRDQCRTSLKVLAKGF